MCTDAAMPVERIDRAIYLLCGQKVMLDRNLAVRRNVDRFPGDFMFVLPGHPSASSARRRYRS